MSGWIGDTKERIRWHTYVKPATATDNALRSTKQVNQGRMYQLIQDAIGFNVIFGHENIGNHPVREGLNHAILQKHY
jgi:hypothetical protein